LPVFRSTAPQRLQSIPLVYPSLAGAGFESDVWPGIGAVGRRSGGWGEGGDCECRGVGGRYRANQECRMGSLLRVGRFRVKWHLLAVLNAFGVPCVPRRV
jgi:hypothetical protein